MLKKSVLPSLPILVYFTNGAISGASFRPDSDGVIEGTARAFPKIIVSIAELDRTLFTSDQIATVAPFCHSDERGTGGGRRG